MLDHRQATEWKPWQGRHGPDARAARNWRNPVPEADWTMQFVCVEEFRETDGFARRMGSRDILVAARVVDAQVLRVFVQAFPSEGEEGFEVHVTWSDDSPCGVSRRRPLAVVKVKNSGPQMHPRGRSLEAPVAIRDRLRYWSSLFGWVSC